MSNLIVKNYKLIISIIFLIVIIPIIPVIMEIIFKFGNIVGTYIRIFGTSICI